MLKINVLNGSRQGTILHLPPLSAVYKNPLFVLEDDVLILSIKLSEDLPNLSLLLHEIEVPFTFRREEEGEWIYEWRPRDSSGGNRSFFRNYYGFAELALAAKDNDLHGGFFLEFHPLEILAKKINAERIASMLDFLARNDGKDLAAAIRVTRLRAGYRAGGKTEIFLLERIEHNIGFIKKTLPSLNRAIIKKFNQVDEIVIPDEKTLVNDKSLAWILENPDKLDPAEASDGVFLYFNDQSYTVKKILESKIVFDYDVYENQVLHGFVVSLILAAIQIKERLVQSSSKVGEHAHFDGYVSFFSQINKLTSSINKNKIARCLKLIAELRKILSWLNFNIPVSKISLGIPKFTQKAKYALPYRALFNKMISWKQFGAPDWGVQDELNSIKDIPKLFEYYLLSVLKTHLREVAEARENISEDKIDDSYEYAFGDFTLVLKYEPVFWTVNHIRSQGSELINTEAWTVRNVFGSKSSKLDLRKSKGAFSNRSPDIILEVKKYNGLSVNLIIDAKYTNNSRAFLDYLPELTMKYLHGIHQQHTGASLSSALMIVNPSEDPITRHFHHDDYSIYGDYPVSPALLVTSIDVAVAHNAHSNLRRDFARLIELAIIKISGAIPIG